MSEHLAEPQGKLATDQPGGRVAVTPGAGAARVGGVAPAQTAIRGAATAFTDIASISLARGVSIALALVSVTIVAHLLTPSQYSILAYIGVISGLMFTATASWTSTAVTRYGREELELAGSLRATSWARLIITAPVVAGATVLIVALKLLSVLPAELTWEFAVIAIATGLELIAAEHVLNLLEASGRMKLTAAGLALQRVFSIFGIVVLIVCGVAKSPGAIALVWLGVGSLFALGLTATVWRVGIWPVAFDRPLFRRMVAFSLPMIAFAVSQYVIGAIDVVILGAYRPTRDVGLYAIAYQGYGVLQQLATTASIVLSPLFVSLRVASQEHVIGRFYDRLVPQVLLISAIGVGLIAPLLRIGVPLVFGHAFTAAAVPFALLLLAWILYAATSFVAPILVLHERTRAVGKINIVAALVNVLGDWLLVGVFGVGIAGPAIVTGTSLAVIAVGYFYVAADCIGQSVTLPVGMVLPGVAGVALALAFSGALGVAVSTAGTLVMAAIVVVCARPFTSSDADLIEKLDIPAPGKRLVLRILARVR